MGRSLIHSFTQDFAGKIGQQAVSFIIGIILARLLTPEEFGIVGMAAVFIGMSEIFTHLGLSAALIQRKSPTEEHYSSSFYLNIGAGILLSAFFFIMAPAISRFFSKEELVGIIRVLSFGLLIGSFSIIQEARFNKDMRFDLLAKGRIFSTSLSGLVGIGLAFKGFGVWSLVVQNIVSRVLHTIYDWYVSAWRPKLIFKIRAIKELWSYSIFLFISNSIGEIYNQLDSLMIAKIFSATDLGLYSKAKALNKFAIKYSASSISTVTFPAMTSIKDEKERMIDLGLKAEKLVSFLSFGLLGWLFVSAESLILTLYGQKWVQAVPIFRLLCLSGYAYPISSATLSMLKASGDSRSFLKVQIWKKAISITGLIIGFLFGLRGFLISLIITENIAVVLNMLVTGKSLNISLSKQAIPLTPYFIFAALSALVTELLPVHFKMNVLELIFNTIAFLIIYIVFNQLFKTIGLNLFKTQINRIFVSLKMLRNRNLS